MIAPIDKIKTLLNDDIVSLFGDSVINDAYTNAYKIVNNLITDESVLDSLITSGVTVTKYQSTHTTTIDTDCPWFAKNFCKNRRILSVQRKNSAGDNYDDEYYECSKISTADATLGAVNPNSIRYENDRWNPKWYKTTGGQLFIIPKNTGVGVTYYPKGIIYWLTFPNFSTSLVGTALPQTFDLSNKNFSQFTAVSEGELFYGIPGGAQELLYIEMALNIIQSYMADFVYNEEDTELVSLVKEHAAALLAKKNEEMNYVMAKYGNLKEKQ